MATPPACRHGVTFDGGYVWVGLQNGDGWIYRYTAGKVAVEPDSFGKIKALFR